MKSPQQLVASFMSLVEGTERLDYGMFNIHLYDENYIELSVAEEHDLGAWIEQTQEHGGRFSNELRSSVSIVSFLHLVCHYKKDMENQNESN